MSRPALVRALEHVRATAGRPAPLADDQLLMRFVTDRDEAAFAELVRRHGPLVRGVARRQLADAHEADDVVQGTFLALARQAARVGGRPLAPWLFTVAHRLACKARVRAARRPGPTHNDIAIIADPLATLTARELVTALDDELARLPERYRLPLVLCGLDGLTRDEAAMRLGWSLGSLRGRLERGRELLRTRLAKRGMTVPAVLAGGLLVAPADAMPAALVATVTRTAMTLPAASGMLRVVIAILTLSGLAVGGTVVWTGKGWHGPASPQAPAAATASAKPPPVGPVDPTDPKFAGHFSGQGIGPDGKPFRGARVFITPVKDPPNKALAVRARTDADGRFEFDAPDLTYTEYDGLPARREGILIATADGFAPDWFQTWGQDHGDFLEYWDPVKGAAINLQLAKDDVPIRGRLLDPAGHPLVGARVRLSALMVPRKRDLSAYLDHWSKASVYSGFLTKVPDYEREIYQPHLIPGLITETRTDADGRFKLSGLGRDRLAILSVSAPNVVDTSLEVMTRAGPDVGTFLDPNGKPTRIIHGADFTLQLNTGRTIKGRVIDRKTRAPIPGMWVGPQQNPISGYSSSAYPWVTDENGRFTITGLNPAIDKVVVVAVAPPGVPYELAAIEVKGDTEAAIECARGIPFHLKVKDEQGKPVEAEVTYVDVQPNANVVHDELHWPVSPAARKADGTYEGVVLPGPGAVLVKALGKLKYRPAHVNPKEFFAPGRTKWTQEEQASAYGNLYTLATRNGPMYQDDYAAIVFVDPPPGSGPLELSATVVADRPRQVSLVDPDGKPVVGANMIFGNGYVYRLRAASFPLTGLHGAIVVRRRFVQDDRRLIGFLTARGVGDTPITVHMQRWGTVTGRLVDEHGKPKTLSIMSGDGPVVTNANPDLIEAYDSKLEENGRFRIEKLIPGQSYSCAKIRLGTGNLTGPVFDKLVLQPGEVRDLGDVRVKPVSNETPRAK